MISFLRGTILEKNEKTLTVLTASEVGYGVRVSRTTLEKNEIGSEIQLYIHTHVREDDISLYGFERNEELIFFKQLLSVNGVGPKIAMEILSKPLEKVTRAILEENRLMLIKIPGLGKKTVERIILELKSKIVPPLEDGQMPELEKEPEINQDVIAALINLGYQRYHILNVLKKIDTTKTTPEELVRYFLKNL